MTSLTIAIPTFNRAEVLNRNLAAFAQEAPCAVSLLVVDNASSSAVHIAPEVHDILAARGVSVRIVRNRVNIGGGANILRCIEQVETPWVALCGDDDQLCANGIDRLLELIARSPKAALIKCSSRFHSYQAELRGTGIQSFLGVPGDFNSLLFMSSTVLHVPRCIQYLRFGYLMNLAYAPHVAIALLAIRESEYVVSPLSYATANEDGPAWSPIDVVLSAYYLADLPLTGGERRAVVDKIGAAHRPERELLDILALRSTPSGKAEANFLWRKALRVHLFHSRGLKRIRAVLGLIVAPLLGGPARRVLVRLYQWRTGRQYSREFISRHHGL